MKRYLIIVWGGVEPLSPFGSYPSEKKRNEAAKKMHREGYDGDKFGDEDIIFALDIDKNGKPSTWSYSGGFFEEEVE